MRYQLTLLLLCIICCNVAGAQIPEFAIATMDFNRFRYVLNIDSGYINDHCLIHAGNRWHLFFTQGRISDRGEPWGRDGNEVVIGHATSTDLMQWEMQQPALQTGTPGAPYVIEKDGRYYSDVKYDVHAVIVYTPFCHASLSGIFPQCTSVTV